MSEKESYDLKKSMDALGQLVPCLKDADGVAIDGLHRYDEDPDAWTVTLKQIDNPVKCSLARVAVNFCRRTMKPEELEQEIGFQIGAGLTPQEIAEQTGIGLSTVFKYMPEQLKDKKKVEAGKKGGEAFALRVEQKRKTQETIEKWPPPKLSDAPVNCTMPNCGLGTWWPTYLTDGRVACPRCLEQLWKKGEITKDDLLKEGERPPVKQPEEPKRKAEPPKKYKPEESWSERKARMQPQHSHMEVMLLEKLHGEGIHPVRDREFCLQSTTPDFYFPKLDKAIYVDGPVHKNREARDDAIRETLASRHNLNVVTIKYEEPTDKEINRVYQQIKEEVTS